MSYKIETITVYEAFESMCECPMCAIHKKLSANYTEYYLGNAAMMPEIRVQVNKHGFCKEHLVQLYAAGSRLPMALQMHSMLKEQNNKNEKLLSAYAKRCAGGGLFAGRNYTKARQTAFSDLQDSLMHSERECLICGHIKQNMDRYTETIPRLYFDESRFKQLLEAGKGFCYPHLLELLASCERVCSANELERLVAVLTKQQAENMRRLESELEHFTKMFDYRNRDADWGNARTAVSRTVDKISGATIAPSDKGESK